MQTLKTAVVVILLLVVFYGVYETLNRPPDEPPHEVAQMEDFSFAPPDIQVGESAAARSPAPPPAPSRVDLGNTQVVAVPPTTSNRSWPELPEAGGTPFPEPGLGVPRELAEPASPEPPRSPQAPPLIAPSSPATRPETEPGDPRLQSNPFVHEDVVVRPPSRAVGAPVEQLGVQAFERAWKQAQSLIKDRRYHEALATLSAFYKSPDLTPQEHQKLLDVLDSLAGRVIYSREHLCEPAYTVRGNERLSEIAQRYGVPPQVLQKINGIENPDVLVPGMELKVVTGPFRADVDLNGQELTVFLGQLYAGRFPIAMGLDFQPTEGAFTVRDKRQDRVYYGMDGRQIPAGDPANPFGQAWLDLGREISIHGSATAGGPQQRGCISLSPQDADDIYGILSIGSAVRILR